MTENLTDNLPGPAGRRVSPGAGPAQSAYLQGSRLRLLFVALMAGVLAYTFASSIVAPALPFIQHRLGSSVSATAFVLTAFLLTASVASPIMGGLADMYGKKQMFLIALYGLAAGLLVCALGAHSIGWLIAGRTLQGISIGAVTVAFAIVREEFPAEKAPGAMGAVSAGFGIGSGAGVVAAGLSSTPGATPGSSGPGSSSPPCACWRATPGCRGRGRSTRRASTWRARCCWLAGSRPFSLHWARATRGAGARRR